MIKNQSIFAALRGEKEPPATTRTYALPSRTVVSNTTSDTNVETIEDIARRFDQDVSVDKRIEGLAGTVIGNSRKKEIIFVYGTLKKEGHRGSLLAQQDYIGPAITGINFDLKRTGTDENDFDFPVLLQNSKYVKGRQYLNRVVGELYSVDLTTLNILDGIENIPRMFERKRLIVYHYDPEKNHILAQQDAYAYVGTPSYWENAKLNDCPKMEGKAPHLYYPVKKNKGIVG